jgi:hypothetical protein
VQRPDDAAPDEKYPPELVQALISDMLAIYERCGREVNYRPHGEDSPEKKYWPRRYHQKLKGIIANSLVFIFAEQLVLTSTPSKGFFILKDADRLDLTVEALVADESKPYHLCFTQAAVDAARAKLTEHAGRPSVPALPAPADASRMLRLQPGDSLYFRVEVGPNGELHITVV